MNTELLAKILQDAYLAKLPVLLFGAKGIGKSSFCQDLFAQAEVILENQLESIFQADQKIFIIENISEAAFASLQPLLSNGLQGQNFLIFTSEKEFSGASHMLKLEFEFDKSLWLLWAKEHNLHDKVLQLVQDDQLTSLSPKDWENISQVLKHFSHKDYISLYLKGFLSDQSLIDSIVNFDISQQVAANHHPKDLKAKILLALESISDEQSKKNLRFYLDKEAFFDELNEVLADAVLRQKLDALLLK